MTEQKKVNKGLVALVFAGIILLSALAVFSMLVDTHNVLAKVNGRSRPSPPGINLISPTNGAKGITETQVTLTWQGIPTYRGRADHTTITNYLLHVGTTSPQNTNNAQADVFNANVGTLTSKTITVELGKTYYWAVRADDIDGSTWSQTWSFSTNSKPVASIDSVEPQTPREGVEVTLKGSGTDPDGDEITAYKWESDQDGELGTKATIKTVLSVGDHIITFTVQDKYGVWSEPVTYPLTVVPNNPPTKPSGIQPTETHDLKPTIRWNPSQDPDMDDVVYYISIGTSPGIYDIVQDEKVTTTSYKLPRALEYETDKMTGGRYVKEYYISIKAEDSYGASSDVATQTLKVVNSPPKKPTITITPSEPYSSSYLKVEMPKPSEDDDGDEVQYTYKWYVDSGAGFMEQTQFEDQTSIPSRYTHVGETWKVEVIPNDGIVDGEKATAQVTIIDAEPNIVITKPASSDLNNDGIVDEEDYEEAGDSNGDGIPDNVYFVGQSIKFDAKDTEDIDEGQDLTFTWDFGDDSDIAEGATVRHTYTQEGEYAVVLTVDDGYVTVTNEDQGIYLIIEVTYPPPEITVDPKTDALRDMEITYGDIVDIPLIVRNSGNYIARGIRINITDTETYDLVISKDLGDMEAGEEKIVSVSFEVKKDARVEFLIEVYATGWAGNKTLVYTDIVPIEVSARGTINVGEEPMEGVEVKAPKKAKPPDYTWAYAVAAVVAIILVLLLLFFWMYLQKKKKAAEEAAAEAEAEASEEQPQPPVGMLTGIGPGGMGVPGMPGAGVGMQYPGLPGYAPMMQQPYGYGMPYGTSALPPAGMAGGMTAPGAMGGMDMYGAGAGMGGMQQQIPALPQPTPEQQPPQTQQMGAPQMPPEMGTPPMTSPTMEPQPPMGGPSPMAPPEMGGGQPTMGGPMPPPAEQPPQPGAQGAEQVPPPQEGPTGPTCPHCGAPVEEGWLMCPVCKGRLM